MMQRVTAEALASISNPDMRGYAGVFVEIEELFREQVSALGLPFEQRTDAPSGASFGCPREHSPALPAALAKHVGARVAIENDGKSYVANWQSSACVNCRLGLRSKTFLISTLCPRRCFFCFNPNQLDYEQLRGAPKDAAEELADDYRKGARYTHLALTGGEPLVHPEETLAFFRRARELYPEAHKRLYTSGWGLDGRLMAELQDAGLDEIRFSIKTEDAPESVRETLETINRATAYLEDVMVEMPVVPGEIELMKDLLKELDAIGIRGINLLELGYPLENAPEFRRRGLRIKALPLRVLYDYSYAGGLPVAGSEEACLYLLGWALDEGVKMGLHYCSMENKLSGQVFQQNAKHAGAFPHCVMSRRDHFIKSAKMFGDEAARALPLLRAAGASEREMRKAGSMLEFPPSLLPQLAGHLPDAQVLLGYGIVEMLDSEPALRELRVDLTTPASFDSESDL